MRLNALQLRQLEEERARGVIRKIKRNPIYFILEDIYDTYNIGGLFRLADALAVEKMYLVGETETPPNSRIKKASIGTHKVVPWEYKKTTKEAIESITYNVERVTYKNNYKNKQDNKKTFYVPRYTLNVVAVEQHKNSVPYNKANYQFPLALIFGNESFGIKRRL